MPKSIDSDIRKKLVEWKASCIYQRRINNPKLRGDKESDWLEAERVVDRELQDPFGIHECY